jgi:hypothetical protein
LTGVKKDEPETALGYFENDAPACAPPLVPQCGLFVGSGVVEASCKAIIGQRVKQAGMHWTAPDAQAVIAVRRRQTPSLDLILTSQPDSSRLTSPDRRTAPDYPQD